MSFAATVAKLTTDKASCKVVKFEIAPCSPKNASKLLFCYKRKKMPHCSRMVCDYY